MSSAPAPAIWWLRRDLRLADNPALRAAVADGAPVLPLFVLDPVLLGRAGNARRDWLFAALHVLDADLRAGGGPGLSVLRGRPASVVPGVARTLGARRVHISADFAPYGGRRDDAVATALAGLGAELVRTGSPYAVAPGALRTQSGQPFRVFSPFFRAWAAHGVHEPAPEVRPDTVTWTAADGRDEIPTADPELRTRAGEGPARQRWRDWLERVEDYARLHDPPGADATSHTSVALRWGHLHPRTLLADLIDRAGRVDLADLAGRRSPGPAALARQLAWRDFYADVLFHRPDAVRAPIRGEFERMPVDEPATDDRARERLAAWQQGRTGFPLVDAGMRQLLAEGWMHNRVRMVVASFLVKDLHLGWWHGAAWFLERLHDGDLAQNQLNWQWVAGCGTDAAPFFRVFNPTGQAERCDPDGAYIRRHVPELAAVSAEHLHQPWLHPGGPPAGYPAPIVDHAVERREALRRYALVKDG